MPGVRLAFQLFDCFCSTPIGSFNFCRLARETTDEVPLHAKFAYKEAVKQLESLSGQQENTGLKQQANQILGQIIEAVQR